MKKMFRRRLAMILSVGMLFSLSIAFVLQITMLRRDANTTASWLFWQVQQILTENQVEAKQAKEDFSAQCLSRAKAAAYIVQNSGTDLTDQAELSRIAELLQIDELHFFDTTGTIYAGSEPKYFGYNFNSGEQMQFFLPMMVDHSLELCQDVTPNTAEGKLMQYAAVWREDDTGIVQIGVTPARVLEAIAKNELSYIFSLLTESDRASLCAADPETFEILGSTDTSFVGRSLTDLGFSPAQLLDVKQQLTQIPATVHPDEFSTAAVSLVRVKVNGVCCYCNFTNINGLLVGRFCEEATLYAPAYQNTVLLLALLVAIFLLMQLSIAHYLDKVILRGLSAINGKLRNIADGQLDETVDITTTPEFAQLSWYINHMVKSILSTTAKLSFVLSAVQLPIAVYEYGRRMNRVYFTSKLPEILNVPEGDALLHDRLLFEQKLEELKSQSVGDNVYRLPEDRYVKIEAYTSDTSYFGLLVDVTADMAEKKQLEYERDVDLLTGLLNRRAFYDRLDGLFEQPEKLKFAALLMMDTDDLKLVNDRLGHEAGDEYLRGMAHILEASAAPDQIAARLSGDEFAVFLYGCDTEAHLRHRIAQLAAQRDPSPDTPHAPRFSMGAALYPTDSPDYHTLLTLADQRMYEDKRVRKARPSRNV